MLLLPVGKSRLGAFHRSGRQISHCVFMRLREAVALKDCGFEQHDACSVVGHSEGTTGRPGS